MAIRLLIIILFLSPVAAIAQFKSEVHITAIANGPLKEKMEKATTLFIDEINRAFASNSNPKNPDATNIKSSTFDNVFSLWEVSHFKFPETQLILDGLHLPKGGHQVRDIPIYFKEESNETKEREMALTFDENGKITDCFLCLANLSYKSIFAHSNNSVTDLRRRQTIVDFIEKFRTSYNTKDLAYLRMVFSDRALIIIGKEISLPPVPTPDMMRAGNIPSSRIEYVKSTKAEYMDKLANIFKKNQYIKIDFDSIEVMKSKINPNIFGVTLYQKWNTSSYSDVGWIFLMIDFKNEDSPLIHVRTWQPTKDENGRLIGRKDVFSLRDFTFTKD